MLDAEKESAISEMTPSDGRRTADFVDVRYYVSILLTWWREIVVVVVVVACATAMAQWRRGPVYEAVADVAIIRPQLNAASGLIVPELALGADAQSLADSFAGNRYSLAATMLGLVHQGGLAQHVQSRLGERFAGVPAASLLGRIAADLVTFRDETISDLIRITATAGTPQEAADLATIWAEEYVDRLNRMLRWPQSRLDAIRSEMAAALQASNQSQQRLEAFIAENDLDALRRRLVANDQAVDILWQARNQAMIAQAYRDAGDQAAKTLAEAASDNAGSEPPSLAMLAAHMDASTLTSTIVEFETESRTLAVDIEAADNRLALLTAERDADRSVLQALRDAVIDLHVRNASSLSQLRLASIAVVPAVPTSPSPTYVAVVAGVAALPAVAVLVLLANLMGVNPIVASLVRFIARRRMS